MKIVIQCASKKVPEAGCLQTRDGQRVVFVAEPAQAPVNGDIVYAHPDDPDADGVTWRQHLIQYNRHPGDNLLGLLPAWRLYRRDIYGQLVQRFGAMQVYILSAGWGLIRSDFLMPYYDITFSSARNVEGYKRRGKKAVYADFNQLPEGEDDIVFFGGKDYLPLFCELTGTYQGRHYVFHVSATPPRMPGCTPVPYETTAKTNWHYLCARDFIEGQILLPQSQE